MGRGFSSFLDALQRWGWAGSLDAACSQSFGETLVVPENLLVVVSGEWLWWHSAMSGDTRPPFYGFIKV